jgi:hypothetical protein
VYLQLNAIVADLHAAQRRVHALRQAVSPEAWIRRPAPTRWSPAECVAHLNLTSEAFLPLLRAGVEEARRRGRSVGRYRRDVFGWLIWRAVTPTGTFKTKTATPFVPAGDLLPDALTAKFDRLQEELIACVRASEGLPIDRVKIASPFASRVKYNVYAAMTIVARHEHRHLLQAEQAAGVTRAAPV